MQSKDLKSLLLKLNNYIVRNLDTATGLGINRSHYEINIEDSHDKNPGLR